MKDNNEIHDRIKESDINTVYVCSKCGSRDVYRGRDYVESCYWPVNDECSKDMIGGGRDEYNNGIFMCNSCKEYNIDIIPEE